jgi:hypothetical protein
MNLIGLSMVLVGAFANFGFDVSSQKAVTPIVNEWKCSNYGKMLLLWNAEVKLALKDGLM